jgi:tetratricopeptide (TPR) repeat protein
MRPHRIRSLALALLVSAPAVAWAQEDDGPIKPPEIPTTPLPPEDKPVDAKPGATEDQVASTERRAQELFDEGKYEEAIGHWRFADGLRKDPGHEVSIGRALAKLGKLLEARELLRKLTSVELPPSAKTNEVDAHAAAEDVLRAVEKRIPKLDVAVRVKKGQKYIVRVDGSAVDVARLVKPIEVDPGKHALELEPQGGAVTKRSVDVKEATTEKVMVDLRPPPGFEVQKLAPYAFGLGAIGLGVGGVTGGLSLAKVNDVRSRCLDYHCLPADQSKADSAKTLGTVSTIGFIAGGVLAATGVVFLVWPRDPDAAPAAPTPKKTGLALGVGPGSVVLGGGF